MRHYQKLQGYVPPLIADWIRVQAQHRNCSVSIIMRDLLVAAWTRENEVASRPAGANPEWQRVFITVALDALLAHHPDPTLRDETIAAYHRRLAKLGFIQTFAAGDENEA